MEPFSPIGTERLIIRRLEIADSPDFFAYRTLPEVCRYQGWRPKNRQEIDEFIQKNSVTVENTPGTWLQLAINLKNGQLIGDIGIHFLEDIYQVEIGYSLAPKYQGYGYACEAIGVVINYLFIVLHKHRITASVDPENTKSIRLLERLGMRKEAQFIQSFRMDDKWTDDCVYAILEEEWLKSAAAAKNVPKLSHN